MKKILSVMGLVCATGIAAMGQELVITSFPGNGMLTWAYPTNNVKSYRVECASQADGPYTNFTAAAARLDAIAPTGATMAAAVPMFYRVVVTTNPPPLSNMVLIPGGTKTGTNPLGTGESYNEYYPATYNLTVTTFYMDKYEVSKALWDEVYNWAMTNGYSFINAGSAKAANHPVDTLNWYDCVKWCNARSQKEGFPAVYLVDGAVYKFGQADNVFQNSVAGYRLPTDVEWHYAARGGVTNMRFPWGDTNVIIHARANYYSTDSESYDTSPTRGYHPTYATGGFPYTSPVGSFAANGYGLHDMAGNVTEWCFDWYPGYEGTDRVVRGGDWLAPASSCRVGKRGGGDVGYAYPRYGFRTVLTPGQLIETQR